MLPSTPARMSSLRLLGAAWEPAPVLRSLDALAGDVG